MTKDAQRQMDNKLAEVWGKKSKADEKADDEKCQVKRPLSQPREISPEREEEIKQIKDNVQERLFSDRE